MVGDIDLAGELWGPVFEPLRDRTVFVQAAVTSECGTIIWPSGADFAPKWLYDAVRTHAST